MSNCPQREPNFHHKISATYINKSHGFWCYRILIINKHHCKRTGVKRLTSWGCRPTYAVFPCKATFLGFWWSLWAFSPANLHTERSAWIQAHPRVTHNASFNLKQKWYQSDKGAVDGWLPNAKKALIWTFPQLTTSGIIPTISAVHFLAFTYLAITIWSKECVITGIEGLTSSGNVTNMTGTLLRIRSTFCWTVRMNILSAFAHSTASLSSHLSMRRIAQPFWTSQRCMAPGVAFFVADECLLALFLWCLQRHFLFGYRLFKSFRSDAPWGIYIVLRKRYNPTFLNTIFFLFLPAMHRWNYGFICSLSPQEQLNV